MAYQPLVSINKALLNPYFWRGYVGVDRLTSHSRSPQVFLKSSILIQLSSNQDPGYLVSAGDYPTILGLLYAIRSIPIMNQPGFHGMSGLCCRCDLSFLQQINPQILKPLVFLHKSYKKRKNIRCSPWNSSKNERPLSNLLSADPNASTRRHGGKIGQNQQSCFLPPNKGQSRRSFWCDLDIHPPTGGKWRFTAPKFNSSPLKNGGWKTTFLLGR